MAAPTSPANYASPALPERVEAGRSGSADQNIFAGEGLTFERVFTQEGQDVFDTTEWELRTAAISDERGAVVFEQKDCEIPKGWSMLATNVVVSKYFRGKVGTPQRETSVRQIVSRVADTIAKWGKQGGYFASDKDATAFHDELKYLLLHQYMAFNSPVWFNLGVPGERPQVSACQPYDAPVSTPQGLIPIGKLVEENAVGTVVYDAHGVTRVVATKANGRKKVLRLHTMAGYTLDVTADHLVWKKSGGGKGEKRISGKFVEAGTLKPGDKLVWYRTPLAGKSLESSNEEAESALAGWLQGDGFVGQYETGTNRSLTIEAMVVNGDEEQWVRNTLSVVFPKIHSHTRAVVTQSDVLDCKRIRVYGEELRSFITKWNLLSRGTAMQVPAQLFHAPYAVAAAYLQSLFQAEGYVILRENASVGLDMISEDMVRGIQRLLLRFGIYSRVRYKADARTNRKGCWCLKIATLGDRKRFAQQIGFIGQEKQNKLITGLEMPGLEEQDFKTLTIDSVENLGEMEVYDIQTESGEYLSGNIRVHNCFINSVDDTMESILTLAKTEGMLFKWGSGTGTNFSVLRSSRESLKGGGTASGPVSFMRGFDAFAGAIKSGGKCFKKGTLVATPEGLKPIETLQTGDSVLTHKGTRTIADFMPNGVKQCYKVQTEEGYEIEITEGHKFAFWNELTGKFDVKPIEEFAIGEAMYVLTEASEGGQVVPLTVPEPNDPVQATTTKEMSFPAELSDKLAYIVGLMYGDGEVRKQSPYRVRVAFCKDNAGNVSAERFRAYCAEVFGEEPTLLGDAKNHQQLGFTRKRLIEFLDANGLAKGKAHRLGFPTIFFQALPEVRAAFIAGLFDADGNYQQRGGWSLSSIDRPFLVELQRLLLSLGVPSKLRQSRAAKSNWQTLYRLHIVGHTFIERMVERIQPYSAKAQVNYVPSPGADKGWGYRPSLLPHLAARVEQRGGYCLIERRIGTNETTGYGALKAIGETHPHPAVSTYAAELARCVQVTLESVTPTEYAETYDVEVEDVHLLCANGFYASNTRRAAKMVILNADHPDVEEFIECKADAEKKAHALIEAGYNGMFNVPNGAYDSVFFQNANHSVRATDDFMRAVELDRDWSTVEIISGKPSKIYHARELMHKIAQAAWVCGDPGMQFDTTINRWHTCPNTNRINASNPCCITGDTQIAVADGRNAVPIRELVGTTVPVYTWDHKNSRATIAEMHTIEVKRRNVPVYRVTLDDGSSFRATDDHLIMLRNGSYRQVKDLKKGDSLNPFHSQVREPKDTRTKRRYIYTGSGWRVQYRWVWQYRNGAQPEGYHIHQRDFDSLNDTIENLEILPEAEHLALHRDQMLGDNNPARRMMNDAWREHISQAVKGEKNPNFGKTHDEITREKMRKASAQRWDDSTELTAASERATEWMATAKAEGRPIGRKPGTEYHYCCPACRENFTTRREGQVFCSQECRYSPIGLAMIGKKGGVTRQGHPVSEAHREKLRASSIAAVKTEDKQYAQQQSLRARCLKAARLLMDAGYEIGFSDWEELRETARELGAAHVPQKETLKRFFADEHQFREATALYNHKVVSVEFDGEEDVYDGTVDGYHNFAIITSATSSVGGGKSPNYSGIYIHNSEYMFLDDSACNLASLNLMRFRKENREFDVDLFMHAVRVTITAMEIMVSNAAYPTDKITVNSYDYRPLGLGYANLGALLMARGVPYDSDEGRAYAAAITAMMSGEAYHQSAKMARRVGPFAGYERNQQPFLRVMRMHRDSVEEIANKDALPQEMVEAARESWEEAIAVGEENGFRNSQISVLAPTGTIGFLMDCDTTGVEPDIAIVKYKTLVGGGMFKIVNQTVPEALERLGYSAGERKAILEYIEQNDTIEGAPGLSEEHLPIFDCAFRPKNGKRSIHYMGHIRMMAAVQPFLSGAISKTVNMPHEATPDDIAEAYLQAWRMGVKALAIYRDGSKKTQPLSTGKAGEDKPVEKKAEPRPLRRKLPDERQSLTHKFSVGGHEGYLTVGLYPDGTPGEIFITMSKEGSVVSGLMDSFATSISLALQYGVPLRTLVEKFMHSRFEPSGFTGNPDIPMAKSIMDYLFRYLALKFLGRDERSNVGLIADQADYFDNSLDTVATASSAEEKPGKPGQAGPAGSPVATVSQDKEHQVFVTQADAPPCPDCGGITTRNGACYRCANCGTSIGCS
jgi:ribonucleotide reductase alpha subunit